ncbi:DUF7537 family lipoprotein [Halomarina rubra]|uniref:Uncharacterized protein n=1 Tax=Halomarina rubra TaxID=2071873 RepID=A0ABD6ASX7_9EURY|nr:hypothetical protein [Halomarina rubra]
MNRSALLSTLLVVCVVLAGCGGAPAESTDTPATGEPQTSTVPSTQATTTTDATTGDSSATTEEASTGTQSALADGSVVADHSDGLRDTSYEYTFAATADLPNGTVTLDERGVVDRENGIALTNQTTELVQGNETIDVATARLTFVDNGTTYERTSSGNYPTQYASSEDETTGVTPINTSDVGASILSTTENVTWRAVGTETVDGVEVTRYEASGVENFPTLTEQTETGASELDSVQSASATLLVGEDGVVRQYTYDIEGTSAGEESTISVNVRFSNVGSATADLPAWLDEAKQNS